MRTLSQKQIQSQERVSASPIRTNTTAYGANQGAHPLLHLQHRIGNQVMVAMEFEAPRLFWEVYVTFEDFEISDNPDDEAVTAIKELFMKKAI